MPRCEPKFFVPGTPPRRDGFFLLMVLVVIAMATLAVYTFTESMIVMDDAAYLESDVVQASVGIESAESMLRVLLSSAVDDIDAAGGVYNNPAVFAGRMIANDVVDPTGFAFSMVASDVDQRGEPSGLRFGLMDQSARLNVNTLVVLDENSDLILPAMSAIAEGDLDDDSVDNLAVSMLMTLDGMTFDIADAILDWIDEDDEPREYGAESETYATLSQPYQAANGPIASVDELLLVRGVTPALLYGADANRNGILDADEQQRYSVSIETPGVMGWSSVLTAVSAESSAAPDGNPRVDVNGDDLEVVYDEVSAVLESEDLASFIVAYRVAGESTSTQLAAATGQDGVGQDGGQSGGQSDGEVREGGVWTADRIGEVDLTGGGQPIRQLLDLVGARVIIRQGDRSTAYDSPIPDDPIVAAGLLQETMDWLTAAGTDPIPGRVNVNQCSQRLLAGIPVLTQDQIDAILETRQPGSIEPQWRHATWLWTEGIVDLPQMRLLTPLLCGGGDVWGAQIVSYRLGGGAFARWQIILDATATPATSRMRRSLGHLGRGFSLSDLGLAAAPNSTPSP